MNNQEKDTEDFLRQYIDPERIEKAPEGFTSKVMTRIQLEKQPSDVAHSGWRKISVPVISAAVILILLAAAFLIPGSESDSIALPVLKLFKNIKSSVPEVNLSSVFSLTLPSVLMYVFIGIFVLTLFDRALYGVFHRDK
jgi:small-conductance mechanosensitive channel